MVAYAIWATISKSEVRFDLRGYSGLWGHKKGLKIWFLEVPTMNEKSEVLTANEICCLQGTLDITMASESKNILCHFPEYLPQVYQVRTLLT